MEERSDRWIHMCLYIRFLSDKDGSDGSVAAGINQTTWRLPQHGGWFSGLLSSPSLSLHFRPFIPVADNTEKSGRLL